MGSSCDGEKSCGPDGFVDNSQKGIQSREQAEEELPTSSTGATTAKGHFKGYFKDPIAVNSCAN